MSGRTGQAPKSDAPGSAAVKALNNGTAAQEPDPGPGESGTGTLDGAEAGGSRSHDPNLKAVTERKQRPRLMSAPTSSASGDANGTDPVRAYLKEIGRVSLLSPELEVLCAKKIEAGQEASAALDAWSIEGSLDKVPFEERRSAERAAHDGLEAKDLLIEANLRLVVSIAKRYRNRGMAFLDLIQEGNLGLMRAVEKFRLPTWLQVLHVRDVVDPPSHHSGRRRPGPQDSDSRSHGRDDQQGRAYTASTVTGARS